MEIEIQLIYGPIPEIARPQADEEAAGAWAEFRGIVRRMENGAAIAAIEYDAYTDMAEKEMRRILTDLAEIHPCLQVQVTHSLGIVPVGAMAIHIGVAARHRREAFAMLSDFMDRLKQDVPIWKQRVIPLEIFNPVPPASEGKSADDVRRHLQAAVRPLETEPIPLVESAGRVLREPVLATEDQPAFDRSSVDGYAVRLDDPAATFRIVDEIRAGDWKPRELSFGEVVRIATGGALPGDGLQVVMKEDVRVETGTLTVLRRDDERNIRFRGEDARAGQVLVGAGTVLQPGTVGLLASVGCAQPLVTRRPRVLHIATGNEIVSPEQTPAHGQIRDSNSSLVRSFLNQWSIAPEQKRVGEDAAAIAAALRTPHAALDLLLISGGASVGEHDFTKRLLEEAGFTIHVSKTTARPGKPLIVAQRGSTVAFGLPGNPLAHFVCLNLYVRAALEAWSGQRRITEFQSGLLAEELAAGGNARETFWPAHWQLDGGSARLTPLRWSSSGDLTALATANALIRVGSGEAGFKRGSRVEFLPV